MAAPAAEWRKNLEAAGLAEKHGHEHHYPLDAVDENDPNKRQVSPLIHYLGGCLIGFFIHANTALSCTKRIWWDIDSWITMILLYSP